MMCHTVLLSFVEIIKATGDVRRAQALGFDRHGRPLVIDGIPGELTHGGVFLNPMLFAGNPILQSALEELYVLGREEGGNNRGEYVAKVCEQPFVKGKNYRPWCAKWATHVIRKVYGNLMPHIGGARRSVLHLRKHHRKVGVEELEPADLVAWERDDPTTTADDDKFFGHVAIFVCEHEGYFYFIEGNGAARFGQVRVVRYQGPVPHRKPEGQGGDYLYAGRFLHEVK